MGIDYGRLRSLTARELISTLIRDGFTLYRQSGSHQHYRHPDSRRVTVSFHHSGDTFTPKTLKRMIEDQGRWTEDDLRRASRSPLTGSAAWCRSLRSEAASRREPLPPAGPRAG